MDEETIKKVKDPFYTTKSVKRFGMDIPFLAQAAEQCNGKILIDSMPTKGTNIIAEF